MTLHTSTKTARIAGKFVVTRYGNPCERDIHSTCEMVVKGTAKWRDGQGVFGLTLCDQMHPDSKKRNVRCG